jgi:hypothetical protein
MLSALNEYYDKGTARLWHSDIETRRQNVQM